jgi:hypothetical protein
MVFGFRKTATAVAGPERWIDRKSHLKEKEKPDIIDIIERKRLQCYGHVNLLAPEFV